MPGDNELVLRFAKLSDKAFAPVKGSEYAAGYDLRRYFIFLDTIDNRRQVLNSLHAIQLITMLFYNNLSKKKY